LPTTHKKLKIKKKGTSSCFATLVAAIKKTRGNRDIIYCNFFFGGRKGGMGRERCFAMSVLEFVQCFKQKEVEEVIGVLLMEVFVWCCF